jgi:DNA-3-methyladenine glycosylase
MKCKKLPINFYKNLDTVSIAMELIGKTLCTNINGQKTSGIILETEAYNGATDKACHAYNYKLTSRTKTMFETGGIAYIYLCYGIHHLFNVVTNIENEPHAVLIRAIKVVDGVETMSERMKKTIKPGDNIIGPGKLTKALGINKTFDKTSLLSDIIWIEDCGISKSKIEITASTRIGVEYAGEDAKLLYRFTAMSRQ